MSIKVHKREDVKATGYIDVSDQNVETVWRKLVDQFENGSMPGIIGVFPKGKLDAPSEEISFGSGMKITVRFYPSKAISEGVLEILDEDQHRLRFKIEDGNEQTRIYDLNVVEVSAGTTRVNGSVEIKNGAFYKPGGLGNVFMRQATRDAISERSADERAKTILDYFLRNVRGGSADRGTQPVINTDTSPGIG